MYVKGLSQGSRVIKLKDQTIEVTGPDDLRDTSLTVLIILTTNLSLNSIEGKEAVCY
jgi:hypothetical protein